MTEREWDDLRKDLLRFVGSRGPCGREHRDDIVQDVLMALHAHLSEGAEVHDPLAWCRTAAVHRTERISRREAKYLALEGQTNEEGEESQPYFIDPVDPANIVSAQEQLALCPEPLKEFGARYHGEGGPLTSTERAAFTRLKARVRAVIDAINSDLEKKREIG